MILDFNASASAASHLRRETPVVDYVKTRCHAAIDVAHPHRLHHEMLKRQRFLDELAATAMATTSNASFAPDSPASAAKGAALSWRYQGLDLTTKGHSEVMIVGKSGCIPRFWLLDLSGSSRLERANARLLPPARPRAPAPSLNRCTLPARHAPHCRTRC